MLHYSYEGIEHLRRRLTADDDAWGRFFQQSGIDPLEIHYEWDVEPIPSVPWAGALLHRRSSFRPSGHPRRAMVRQSDGLNKEWHDAYIAMPPRD